MIFQSTTKKVDPYGLHRVLEPIGVFPQPALKLDATPVPFMNELLIDVEMLNIDSASFHQLKTEANGDKARVKELILGIVSERGKMHNPVTGSGGMLVGRISDIGKEFPHKVEQGMKVASLISLTLTPLSLSSIEEIDMQTGQIKVTGKAILFASSPYAILPDDLPLELCLAALDVCGAPAQTARLVQAEDRVLVMGAGGKSGLLSLYHAWKNAGNKGQVIALEANPRACEEIRSLGIAHEVISISALDPVAVYEKIQAVTEGHLADITINCVNVPGTELPAILSTRTGGIVYFFSMAVQFTTAALGAEGIGKDVQMMIGNGYVPGHAELTLNTLRESNELCQLFQKRYVHQ